jgi:hypothetical protein
MNFKHDFQSALHAGDDYHALMELVRRHRAKGLSIDATSEALHQIWLDHGFDGEAEGGALQDTLETVMEKVWFGEPVLENGPTSGPAPQGGARSESTNDCSRNQNGT